VAFFKRVVIVGVGLIGGSMGLALKRTGFGGRLVGVSRRQTIDTALELGVIDEGWTYEELPRALAKADLVFLCTPIRHIVGILPQVMEQASPGALVTDVGSTKRRIVARAADCRREDVHFVGGHPMAGSEKAGVTAADPFLFQNAIYILVPEESVPEALYGGLREVVLRVGAKLLELSAETHDEVVAGISHLPQLMATSLVEMVGRLDAEGEGYFMALAAGGFRDMTRIASSPFAPVWEDICGTNADRIRDMIDRYIGVLQELKGRVDAAELAQDFAFANQVRAGIPKDAKGFIHQLFEILVVAEDKPGIIAEIANAMAARQVNINDIEIVKVREGEGGTIRLGFDSDAAAATALEILAGLGYKARRP